MIYRWPRASIKPFGETRIALANNQRQLPLPPERYLRISFGVAIVVCLIGLSAAHLQAQSNDPTQDLLNVGRRYFDDLDYHRADSVALVALTIPGLRRIHRIQALQLAAASRFPVGEREQYPDSALLALRRLVRIAPGAPLPRTMTWRGLDSLLDIAQHTTFGATASVQDTASIDGIHGSASIDVVATRPTTFSLRIARPGDPSLGEVLDSIGPVEHGVLHFSPVQHDDPRYPTGAYRVTIVAIDPQSGDRIDIVYRAAFYTPPVNLVRPAIADSTLLRPERTPPARAGAVVGGVLLGAFTYAVGRVYRAQSFKDGNVSPDSRTGTWSIGLGVSTIALGWYLDRGKTIAPNVLANQKLRTQWAQAQRLADMENERRRASYHGFVYFTLEDE